MRMLYVQLFTSIWYRVKQLGPAGEAMLSDEVYTGLGRYGVLTPEEYFRRIEAVYGAPWPLRGGSARSERRLTTESSLTWHFFTRTDSAERDNQFDLLDGLLDVNFRSFFGGIDFQNNLNRAEQMNVVMSLPFRRLPMNLLASRLSRPAKTRATEEVAGAVPDGVVEGGHRGSSPPRPQTSSATWTERGHSGSRCRDRLSALLDTQTLIQEQIMADPAARTLSSHVP